MHTMVCTIRFLFFACVGYSTSIVQYHGHKVNKYELKIGVVIFCAVEPDIYDPCVLRHHVECYQNFWAQIVFTMSNLSLRPPSQIWPRPLFNIQNASFPRHRDNFRYIKKLLFWLKNAQQFEEIMMANLQCQLWLCGMIEEKSNLKSFKGWP